MANRYWIDGTGDWSDTDHWSATSGGSAGASVPTRNDNYWIETSLYNWGVANVSPVVYWSDETYDASYGYGWLMGFGEGHYLKTTNKRVRATRTYIHNAPLAPRTLTQGGIVYKVIDIGGGFYANHICSLYDISSYINWTDAHTIVGAI